MEIEEQVKRLEVELSLKRIELELKKAREKEGPETEAEKAKRQALAAQVNEARAFLRAGGDLPTAALREPPAKSKRRWF